MDKFKDTALTRACIKGNEEIVRQLLARDDVDTDSRDCGGSMALIWACSNGYKGITRQLLARDDFDINANDDKALRHFIRFAPTDMKRSLDKF
jgi:ankyrin repeat protein